MACSGWSRPLGYKPHVPIKRDSTYNRPDGLNPPVNLAASDEKDLSTAQPPTKTDSRVFGANGHSRRPQNFEAPTRERPRQARHLDPAETAGLTRGWARTIQPRGRHLAPPASPSGIQFR